MRQTLPLLVLLSFAVPFATSANSADQCRCAVVPMYPVGGGNWLHYALICNKGFPGCTQQFPTSYVGPPTQGQSCGSSPNSCVNCSDLGSAAADPIDLYFGGPTVAPPLAADLDDHHKIKAFLKANIPAGANPLDYDAFTFSKPFGVPKPVIVELTRTVSGTTETFYASVWKIKGTLGPARSYVGIELSGPMPDSSKFHIWNPQGVSICNAVATESDGSGLVTHTPIPGLLQVQFTGHKYDVALIRLHNSDKNKMAGYTPCQP